MSKKTDLSTQELWAKLFEAPTVEDYFNQSKHSQSLAVFSDYITGLCREKGEKPEQILNRLFSGSRNPSRDTVIQLAFGFELNADEAQQLLKTARLSALHPRVKRDAVIAFCLHNQKPLITAQQLLYENNLPILGGKHIGKQ